MEWLRDQADGRPRSLMILAGYAVLIGALSAIDDLGAALDGEVPAICRVVLGVVGLAGGLLLWTERPTPFTGWAICMAWAALQIPIIAWDVAGSPTTQLLEMPLKTYSQTTVNGAVTSYSELGINFIGVILVIAFARKCGLVEGRG